MLKSELIVLPTNLHEHVVFSKSITVELKTWSARVRIKV